MKHYEIEELIAYVDERSSMGSEIEAHAAECAACADDLGWLRRTILTLSQKHFWETARPIPSASLAEILDLADRMHEEEADAQWQCDEILAQPAPWRLQQLRRTAGTRAAGIVRTLLERTRAMTDRAPAAALEITTMACSVAETLDNETYPPEFIGILHGQALRTHAYLLSFTGQPHDALECAERARKRIEWIPGAGCELARVAYVRAAALQQIDRAEEAVRLLQDAAQTFIRHGEQDWYVNARIAEGAALYDMGAVERALAVWRSVEGDRTLDELGTVRIAHNIALCLADLGQPAAAVAAAARCVADFERLGHITERTRSRTVLGRALLACGRADEAIPILRQTHREYTELNLFVEAALASLELAEGLLVTNRPHDVPALCREVIALCTKAGMRQPAATALAYLREALALGTATPRLVRDARVFLRRSCAEQPRVFARGPGGDREG